MKTPEMIDKKVLREMIVVLNQVEDLIPNKIRIVAQSHTTLFNLFVQEVKNIPMEKDDDIPQNVLDLYNDIVGGEVEVEAPPEKPKKSIAVEKMIEARAKGSMTQFIDSCFEEGGTLQEILEKVIAKEKQRKTSTYGYLRYFNTHMKDRVARGWQYNWDGDRVTGVRP